MGDLVAHRGTAPLVGRWDHPLADPNLEDAPIVHALDRLAGVPGVGRAEAAYRARFRMKSWQYMTVVSDELFVAFVVGTAGFAGNGFVYAVELPEGRVHKRFGITPMAVGTRVAPTSTTGQHRFKTRDLAITIDNLDGGRRFAADVRARAEEGGELRAELAFASGAADEHFSLCVPLAGGRWSYTHKFGAFAVTGKVTLGDRTIELAPGRAFGTLDYSKMYALRHAVWKWVALAGRTRHGKIIGLNLVDPTPDAPITENAVWIDGVRDDVDEVQLTALGDDIAAPWHVRAGDSLDLEMRAVAHVEQRLDAPLVNHRLRHVVGRFTGRLRTRNGHVHDLEDIVGIAEDNDTWW